MAPLASIPEANTSLRSTFDTHRPRSRVVFLTSRPGRNRCPRKLVSKKRPRSPEDNTPHFQTTSKGKQRLKSNRDTSSGATGESSAWTKSSFDAPLDIPDQLRKSESPFDLDAFPQPPSTNIDMYPDRDARNIATHSLVRGGAPKPPLALAQRRLLVPVQREPATIRRSLRDAATDLLHPSKRQSVDSVLMTAVSRSIAQQLRLVSNTAQWSGNSSQPRSSPMDSRSCSSSRRRSLNRFTRDLETYAERTSAKGKIVRDTSTPPTDAATLHTVTELLPYRQQVRAAGLAVTSKEQTNKVPRYLKEFRPGLPLRKLPRQGHRPKKHTQLDGYEDSGPSQSTHTEISFTEPKKMDEFRYALIDEAPTRKNKKGSRRKRPSRRCLPCFPKADDFTTDTEWAHFKAPSAKPTKASQKQPPRGSKGNQPIKSQPAMAGAQGLPSSVSQSPHQKYVTQEPQRTTNDGRLCEWDRPNFITTGRRHSMTMPKFDAQSVDCYIKHRQRPGRDGLAEAGKVSLAKSDHEQQHSTNSAACPRRPDAPPMANTQVGLPKKPFVAQQRGPQDTLLGTQVDGHRGSRPRRPLRPRSTRIKSIPVTQYDPHHIGICCPKSRGVPAKLTARPNIPKRTSSIKGITSSTEIDYNDRELSDRDVLRGLHVAAAAACNEEIDAFVRNRTGLRIRRFLADLMVLETLTAVRAGEDGQQHARRRRAEMRKLKQQVRRSREIALTGGLI
ncbi:hypothetical protein QQS21_005017 [Conoideocrella luteorostrata]|uniref:Uncharacterized protein n=1 Tax=Conoideocrella luteorostrata TaxID=1105319 RepID=A0AAJ0CQD0_9HYPO|nr:hypothetical protein QQS21_005017 [Conoideocrella luteorostrata]